MDKADPVDARPTANIGTPTRQSPPISRHGKRRVMQNERRGTRGCRRQRAAIWQNTKGKQRDGWLHPGEESLKHSRQIDCKTNRFEFA